ncbi:DinB family protein [Streptomyces sp. ODS28]|uniref:DinB family protein n=1 Tax=Streptomyces sp. ODS28 TaxID=3136688 RepID=UPI0031EF0EAB
MTAAEGTAADPFGEPDHTLAEPHALLSAYLDVYRDALLRKLDGLPEAELRRSALPSGWTPLELVHHLRHVERRWLRWGFLGEDVPAPWGDADAEGRWRVPADASAEAVFAAFREQCADSRRIVEGAPLAARAAVGGRFATAEEAPTLAWILCHLFQEYARHVGQLDVVREMTDGEVGE